MAKRIWIVNYYTTSPDRTSNPRYLELANAFMVAGYDVITFNASTTECMGLEGRYKEASYGQYRFVHIKAPQYQGNGIKRMWSILSFALSLLMLRHKFEKPDIILHNIHAPFDYPVCWVAKSLKSKYIVEAWDMWPEDFVTFGLLKADSLAMKFAYRYERKLYERANHVIFTLEGGLDYLREKGWTTDKGGRIDPKKVHYINSGVNLEKFDYDCQTHPRKEEDLLNPNTVKILYMGAVRMVNRVKDLIDAAVILKDNKKYQFFIYGTGVERPALEQYVKDNDIDNVTFKEEHIPLEEVAWVASQATINVMSYQKNFGIHGISSGKMFQYFAAGKPILCNIKLNYSEISRHQLGVDRDLETPEQYVAAIREIAEQPQDEYNAMCARVREAAKRFDYKVLCAEELKVIES